MYEDKVDRQLDRWKEGQLDNQTDEWRDRRTYRQTWQAEGEVGGLTDEWMDRWMDGQMDGWTDRQTGHQNECCHLILSPSKHSPTHENYHCMCFSSKVMAQNVFLHNGGEHNAPILGQHTNCLRLYSLLLKTI